MQITIGQMSKWFGWPRFSPKSSHTKDSKMVLDDTLLMFSIIKKGSRVKWSNPGNEVTSSPHLFVVAIEKGAFGSPSTEVTIFSFTIYIYIYIYIIYIRVCMCVYIYIYIYIYVIVCLSIWVYGISSQEAYLMNPFLYKLTVLFQTIKFSVSTQFNCQKHFSFKLFSLVKYF